MAVLVIAGSGRGSGKTAVGCALIAAMPELRWVAVKVTPHGHGVGEELWEELDSRSDKDTGRYLAAGARRAFLISGDLSAGAAGLIGEARERAGECDAVLVESNRVALEAMASDGEPRVSIALLAGPESEWKASLWDCLERVDALVLAEGASVTEEFVSRFSVPGLLEKPVFRRAAGEWFLPELVRFVRGRLMLANG